MDALAEVKEMFDLKLWRAMDSAPKDGTKIMVLMRDNADLGPILLEWCRGFDIWQVSWDSTDICKEWGDEPEWWMPLPAPPTAIDD